MAEDVSIIGNPLRFRNIEAWLEKFRASPKGLSLQSLMIVTGPHGIGKTTRIRQIVKGCNRWMVSVHPNNCHHSRDLADIVWKACNNQNLEQLFSSEGDMSEKCLVIDEFETLIANDRNIAATLANLVCKSNSLLDIPIILICDSAAEKKLADLRRSKNRVALGIIDTPTLFVHFSDHPKYSGILSDADIHTACTQAQGNYVYAAQLLEQQKRFTPPAVATANVASGTVAVGEKPASNKEATPKNKTKTKVATRTRTVAATAADAPTCESAPEAPPAPTKSLERLHKDVDVIDMFRSESPSVILEVFLQDAWIHPMRFHENLPTELAKFRKGTKAEKTAVYVKCLEHLITWDVCMANANSRADSSGVEWPLANLAHALHIELSKLPRVAGKQLLDDQDEHLGTFTKILSQMSLQKKNSRAWYQTCTENGLPTNLSSHLLHELFPK